MRPAAAAPDQRCTGAAAAFATAWNAERRGVITTAFTATRTRYAAAALARVTGTLDRYAVRWTRAHTEACRATRILGEQTEVALDLRMVCLERRRQEAAALVGALMEADASVVAHAVTAAQGLVDVRACADLAALQQVEEAVPARCETWLHNDDDCTGTPALRRTAPPLAARTSAATHAASALVAVHSATACRWLPLPPKSAHFAPSPLAVDAAGRIDRGPSPSRTRRA
jgi:hypothetical protein